MKGNVRTVRVKEFTVPYKIVYHYSSGEVEEADGLYDTEERAEEEGLYGLSCYKEGGEILNMSNPGDYPWDEDEDDTYFEVIEV